MRWAETLEQIPVEIRARLINAISVGFAWTALAARRASRDADVEAVQSAVAGAHDALGYSLELLPQSRNAGRQQIELVRSSRSDSSPTWQVFLRGQSEDESQLIQGLLASSLELTTRAALAMRSDARTEVVVAETISAQDGLARLHARLVHAGP